MNFRMLAVAAAAATIVVVLTPSAKAQSGGPSMGTPSGQFQQFDLQLNLPGQPITLPQRPGPWEMEPIEPVITPHQSNPTKKRDELVEEMTTNRSLTLPNRSVNEFRELLDSMEQSPSVNITTSALSNAYRAAPNRFRSISPQLPSLLAETLALGPFVGNTGKLQPYSAGEYAAVNEIKNRRALLRARGLPEDLAPYIQIGPGHFGGAPMLLIPKDLKNPSSANPQNPNDWIQQVGPGVRPVPRIRPGGGDGEVGAPVNGGAMPHPGQKACGDTGAPPCFHSTVALLKSDGVLQCTGVLVAPRWVLTAAHCLCDSAPAMVSAGQSVPLIASENDLIATAIVRSRGIRFYGETKRGDDSGFCKAYKALRALPETTSAGDVRTAEFAAYGKRDIALVPLRADLKLSGANMIAKVVDPQVLDAAGVVQLAGLGASAGLPQGGVKTFFTQKLDHSTCAQIAESSGCIPGKEIAMRGFAQRPGDASASGNDTCGGDSGSGVFVTVIGGAQAVLALTSRGMTARCGLGGIYTLVSDATVIEWMQAVIGTVHRIEIASVFNKEHTIPGELARW